jgi:hypothetical protein
MAPLAGKPTSVNDAGERSGGPGRQPFPYFAWLIPAWVGAWLLHDHTAAAQWSPAAQVGYWTVAKLLVWLLPVWLIVRRQASGQVLDYLGLVRPSAGTRVGLVIGLLFVGLAVILDSFTRTHQWPVIAPGALSALTVAPLFEEVMFRGFVLRALEDRGHRFWIANAVTALMFLTLHVPGWYFMGSLRVGQPALAVSVVLIGLVAGYAKRRARSTWASVVVHFVNNLYSATLA